MGMDVYGLKPRSDAGGYFRNSIWWWPPLAAYLVQNYPNLTAGCQLWFTNDGDGLDDDASRALASALRADLAAGKVAAYVAHCEAELAALPLVQCHSCGGSGIRTEGPCGRCQGEGKHRDPCNESIHFDVANVTEFADFLADCGGFAIW
jgi:hypothetical protein